MSGRRLIKRPASSGKFQKHKAMTAAYPRWGLHHSNSNVILHTPTQSLSLFDILHLVSHLVLLLPQHLHLGKCYSSKLRLLKLAE